MSLRITGGRVIDPASGIDEIRDLLIEGGQVADSAATAPGDERIDATGMWVIPGLVDVHVHVADDPTARYGHAMLARAGVTTGLDLGGPVAAVLRTGAEHGAGLTYGSLDLLGRGSRPGASRSRESVRREFRAARSSGGIGLKLHADTPVTPETLEHAVGEALESGSWIALHCGTTATASDLTGLRESIGIAAGRPVHIAHVNSYCRGALAAPRKEADEAIDLLRSAPSVFAESYLSQWNGNSGACRNGRPEVARVRGWLEQAGHAPTEQGLEDAIRAGSAAVVAPESGVLGYVVGDEGVAAWRAANTRIGIGFPINPFDSRTRLATATDGDDGFVVQALATDGGAYPRNVTVEAGLALVALGGLTATGLVAKASLAGARALGLERKGHLGAGADADVAIVDPLTRRVVVTIANGSIVMRDGQILGRGTRVLATAEGTAAVEAAGCTPIPFDPATSGLHRGSTRSTAVQ